MAVEGGLRIVYDGKKHRRECVDRSRDLVGAYQVRAGWLSDGEGKVKPRAPKLRKACVHVT